MRIAALIGAVMTIGFLGLAATPASAQASRTWVSGVGDDVNPCSRTAPCKTWAGAISKTAPGGEIDALDPGGFGGVTITKAITLDGGGGIVASVLVSGTNGIVVAAGASDVVILRNLTINGIGSGLSGIRYQSGKALVVEHVNVMGFTQNGILITPTNGFGAKVDISRSNLSGNATGLGVTTATAGSQNVIVDVSDTVVTNNSSVGIDVTGGAVLAITNVTRSVISNNVSFGVRATNANGFVIVGSSQLAGNNVAATGGAQALSYGNNQVNGNITTNGTFSPIGLQ